MSNECRIVIDVYDNICFWCNETDVDYDREICGKRYGYIKSVRKFDMMELLGVG